MLFVRRHGVKLKTGFHGIWRARKRHSGPANRGENRFLDNLQFLVGLRDNIFPVMLHLHRSLLALTGINAQKPDGFNTTLDSDDSVMAAKPELLDASNDLAPGMRPCVVDVLDIDFHKAFLL
jgi:hypothetical protein